MEWALGRKKILPVVHGMTAKELALQWPMLASRALAHSLDGVEAVAAKIASAVGASGDAPSGSEHRLPNNLYAVPDARSVHFVGRDPALKQLKELLETADSVSVSASIEGLAGIGKTELALQLVHQLGAEGAFPGGIYWLDAENPDLLPAWGTSIADAIGVGEGSPQERGHLALRTLSRAKASTLVVLDNVEAWSQSSKPAPLPQGPHLRFLVTTRQRRLGGAAFRHVELGILEEPYASELLHGIAGEDLSNKPGHAALLEHLGGHALALELAGVFLSEYPGETPATYLEALHQGEDPGQKVVEDGLLRYERTVAQTLTLLSQRLPTQTRSAWRQAACFEPEWVSQALAGAVGLSADDLRGLRRLHLIDMDRGERWRMHRLIQGYGRQAGSEEELPEGMEAFVVGCAEYCNKEIDLVTGAMTYLPDRMHLDRALEQAEGLWGEKDERLPRFLTSIGMALRSAAENSTAEPLYRKALALDEEHRGPGDPTVAVRLNNLANLLQATNRLGEAEPLMRRALAIDENSYGEDHPKVATDLNNLAALLQDTNRLEEAEPLMLRAVKIFMDSLGEGHPNTQTVGGNLMQLWAEMKRAGLPTVAD